MNNIDITNTVDLSLVSQMAYAASPADLSLVSQMAYEKICEGDPDKALDFVLECIPGMPEDYALAVVTGQGWLVPDKDPKMVQFTTTRPDNYFKTPSLEWLCKHRMDDMKDGLKCITNMLDMLKEHMWIGGIEFEKCWVSDMKYAYKMLGKGYSEAAEEWYAEMFESITDRSRIINDREALAGVIYIIKNMEYVLRDYEKSYKIFAWCRDVLNIRPEKDCLFYYHVGSILNDFIKINVADQKVMKPIKSMQKCWKAILKDDPILKKAYDGEALESNILDGYDAGWLSPDGKFYGDDGPTSALLHIGLSMKLNMNDRDAEVNGWIKIHHETCYSFPKFYKDENVSDTIKNPDGSPWNGYVWSDIQLKKVCEYIDKFYHGKMMPGPTFPDYVTTSQLRQMDIIALHEALGR